MERHSYNVNGSVTAVDVLVRKKGSLNQPSAVECISSHGSQNVKTLVKFKEGDSKAVCPVELGKFSLGITNKVINISLVNAIRSILVNDSNAIISINSNKQTQSRYFSVISFDSSSHISRENIKELSIPVMRSGDISKAASALCITYDQSAVGGNAIDMMGYDFVRRPQLDTSVIVFSPGERKTFCQISIIDDKSFEFTETFKLLLIEPSEGSLIGNISMTTISIEGPNDISIVGMKNTLLFVNPSENEVEIQVLRSGGDFENTCSVWCELVQLGSDQEEAETSQLIFPESATNGVCKFPSHMFKTEGSPEFQVTLIDPTNATINSSATLTKVIVMVKQDTAVIQFGKSMVVVSEPQGLVDIPIIRNGNLSLSVSVNCFTRQRTAIPGEDYIDRPKINNSTVTFAHNSRKALCRINLIDDPEFEPEEVLLVKLAHPEGNGNQRVSLGKHKVARVRIENPEDQPKVGFKQDIYTISSPVVTNATQVYIDLERRGDVSKVSRIRVITKDISATAGSHYEPLDDILVFDAQEKR